MATNEQKESTSSQDVLDPTTNISEKSPSIDIPQKRKASEAGLTPQKINIGTRRSALAVIQAETVLAALKKAHPENEYEIHAMATMGDKNQTTALHEFGAKSLWTHELEAQLLDGRLDIVVHCLKDMPTVLPNKCVIGCITEREDPRDAVVMKAGSEYKTLSDLPDGAVVGTSSVRRSAQVKRQYPHLKFKDVRGNVGTRLSKLDAEDGEYSCLILAAAGLLRLDWGGRITQYLDSNTPGGGMLYAVGQGALAIEVREGDEKVMGILKALENEKSSLAGLAERSLMRTLEGGCSVPIGVETTWIEKGKLLMKSIVVSLDGTQSVEAERLDEILTAEDAEEFGKTLAHNLVEKGAGKILEEINKNRPAKEATSNE
ncbi:porphobilinogen deaminase, dipyromethane cofactor binding domain-containing protein [Bisporella sp. PMI_857]|nr:porphobilinogen deaminase, dipyromethane cofactor binding domain-containing protein [Bisporella sp. PMI_857]KAH8600322.1 porphobilinogen deaminase, dipyromethane cofactor binding domain-containing protein [Bisporella sp. PMI_857]